MGFDKEKNAITFPVYDEKHRLVMITERSVFSKKFYIPRDTEKPVYLLFDLIENNKTTAFVCESQINALYMRSILGVPAISLFGTGSEEQYKILKKSGIRHYVLLFDGDIVNVDVTSILNGYYADASRMYIVGQTSHEWKRLVDVAKECRDIGAKVTKPYTFVGDMAKAITDHAHKNGYTVVREFCGHGVGTVFHEDPEVFHYARRGKSGMLLVPGMVFTIEPMVNLGKRDVFVDEEDGWTVCTEDGEPSAQWEHTYVLTEDGLEILT